jgi:hypothetical protein
MSKKLLYNESNRHVFADNEQTKKDHLMLLTLGGLSSVIAGSLQGGDQPEVK